MIKLETIIPNYYYTCGIVSLSEISIKTRWRACVDYPVIKIDSTFL